MAAHPSIQAACLFRSLAVILFAIANFRNKDLQSAVLDVANDSVIANAVFPKISQLRTVEGFADNARAIQYGKALTQKSGDASSRLPLQLCQIILGNIVKFNLPN